MFIDGSELFLMESKPLCEEQDVLKYVLGTEAFCVLLAHFVMRNGVEGRTEHATHHFSHPLLDSVVVDVDFIDIG